MKKYQKFLSGLMMHCVLSGVLWGVVNVYQKGYNTMHQEQIQMASVTLQDGKAEIQVLHQKWPVLLPKEDYMLYYYLYLTTDTGLHYWMYLTDFIKNS